MKDLTPDPFPMREGVQTLPFLAGKGVGEIGQEYAYD